MEYISIQPSSATTDPPAKPAPNPGPDVPPPDRSSRDIPRPGDPPPAKPEPDKPGPVRPKSRFGIHIRRTGVPASLFSGDGHECGAYRAGNNCGPPSMVCSLSVILLLVSGTALAHPPAESIDDDDVLEAVELELRSDEAVSADHLDVTVNAGVVTLSGKTATLLAKRRAMRLIGSLKGVRAIVNRVEVDPGGRSNKEFFADVQAALDDDPVTDSEEIQVVVGQGRVILEGAVDSFAEKQLAASIVAGVRGVAEIDNQLTILRPTLRPDEEIRLEILRRFELNPYLAEGQIDVEIDRGVVTLKGAVSSLNEKALAGFLSWVAGVTNVDVSNLEVEPGQQQERRKEKFTVVRNDVELQRAVQDTLLYDPRVRGEKIKVRARKGAVSLVGNVSSLSAKRAAERSAKNTLGVRRVINHLKVKVPDWPGDVEVTKRARQALARDSHLANFDLKPSSHFGKVYLRGEVNTHFEKERAETVVANVSGPVDVVNRITVDAQWEPKPDTEIGEDVGRRLRWSPLLDTAEINVTVDNGIVRLDGTVDTWQERRAAGRHAYQGGARRVKNELDVRMQRNTPTGLKATLVPKQSTYQLDPDHRGKDFRRLLKQTNPVRDPRRLPPPPDVDLVLELENRSDRPLEVRFGHDKSEIDMSLTGEGAVHVRLARAFTSDFHSGRLVTIKAGENLKIPIRSLQFGFRNAAERWYWTQPGEYMLQVTYKWPADVTGVDMQAVAAPPIPLKVTLPEEE